MATASCTRRLVSAPSRLQRLLRRAAKSRPLLPGPESTRANNFDALRLLAALAVLISHAFALVGREQPTIGYETVGTVGVWVFFGISGFLIAQSWTTDPDLWRYLAKRALRILPALVAVLLLTTLVLGPLFTTLPLDAYLTHGQTWFYLLNNSVMLTMSDLPGVFVGNIYPQQVNGSLWTLQPESIAYLALAALGLFGALRRKWLPPAVALLLIAWPLDPFDLVAWPTTVFLLQAFAVGTSLYVLRKDVPWHGAVAGLLGLAFVLAPHPGLQSVLAVTAIPYIAIYLGYRGPSVLRRLTSHGDFSYGIYIYAWPVGQATVAMWPGVDVLGLVAISVPATYLLAMGSWHLIERPALALKPRAPRRGGSTAPREVDPVTGTVPATPSH